MIDVTPNSFDVSEVTHTPWVACGVDPAFFGTLTISYVPNTKLLDQAGLDAFVLQASSSRTRSAPELVRLIFDACLEALGNVPLQVQLEATTQGRSPISLTIINTMEE
jgi:NADPH-dependent 7-cyano-7-deazaguanine reductase QueF